MTGFGKCARVLAERLASWGADVIVMARRPKQRSDAALIGYKVMSFEDIPIYKHILSEVDFASIQYLRELYVKISCLCSADMRL